MQTLCRTNPAISKKASSSSSWSTEKSETLPTTSRRKSKREDSLKTKFWTGSYRLRLRSNTSTAEKSFTETSKLRTYFWLATAPSSWVTSESRKCSKTPTKPQWRSSARRTTWVPKFEKTGHTRSSLTCGRSAVCSTNCARSSTRFWLTTCSDSSTKSSKATTTRFPTSTATTSKNWSARSWTKTRASGRPCRRSCCRRFWRPRWRTSSTTEATSGRPRSRSKPSARTSPRRTTTKSWWRTWRRPSAWSCAKNSRASSRLRPRRWRRPSRRTSRATGLPRSASLTSFTVRRRRDSSRRGWPMMKMMMRKMLEVHLVVTINLKLILTLKLILAVMIDLKIHINYQISLVPKYLNSQLKNQLINLKANSPVTAMIIEKLKHLESIHMKNES